MPQISMTMFHINKIKTKLRSNAPSGMKVFNDSFDLAIGEHRKIGGQAKPPIQNRMPMQNLRLRPSVGVRLAVPPRMRKLQPNQQPRVRASSKLVLRNKRSAKLRKPSPRMLRKHQLIRISAPRVRDRDGLATPNQFRAARAKATPAPQSIFRRRAVRSPIPPLHRVNSKPIPKFDRAARDR